MNAFTLLAALLGAANITVNLTINGDVSLPEVQPEPEITWSAGTIYVNPEGVAQHGGLGNALSESQAIAQAIDRQVSDLLSQAHRPGGMLQPKPRPSVGRIVHYHPTTKEMDSHGCKGVSYFAALVTAAFETSDGGDLVSVMVFPPGKPAFVPEACVRELPDGLVPDPMSDEAFWSFPARV